MFRTGARKSISFGLVLTLMIPMIVFGQDARRPADNATSLTDYAASRAGKPPVKEESAPIAVKSDLVPEGSPCGWSAATATSIPILDQGTVTIGSNLYTFAGVSTNIIANAYKFDGTTWRR